ncbi:MAG: hypothetical protein R3A80_09080 [Bdellovibrionota bacterium]
MKKTPILVALLLLTTVKVSMACSPPSGQVTYELTEQDKARAYIQTGGVIVIGKHTTNQTELSNNPGLCPNGFGVVLRPKDGETAHAKNYNVAIRDCTKLFQLYLVSSQKFKFTIMTDYGDEGDGVPLCTLSLSPNQELSRPI